MANYEYIISSLPVLHQEDARSEHLVAEEIIEEIEKAAKAARMKAERK